MAREVVLGMIGGVKRRLIDPFRAPPFSTWVRFADPRASTSEVATAGAALFDAAEETLDASSVKVRRQADSLEQLLADPFWKSFLLDAWTTTGAYFRFV